MLKQIAFLFTLSGSLHNIYNYHEEINLRLQMVMQITKCTSTARALSFCKVKRTLKSDRQTDSNMTDGREEGEREMFKKNYPAAATNEINVVLCLYEKY